MCNLQKYWFSEQTVFLTEYTLIEMERRPLHYHIRDSSNMRAPLPDKVIAVIFVTSF